MDVLVQLLGGANGMCWGCGIRGSLLEGSREKLEEGMTLLTPYCFTVRAPAPGGLLEIV